MFAALDNSLVLGSEDGSVGKKAGPRPLVKAGECGGGLRAKGCVGVAGGRGDSSTSLSDWLLPELPEQPLL